MESLIITKPKSSEYAEYYDLYISMVEGDNLLLSFKNQLNDTLGMLESLPEEKGDFRYAEGKWSIKELVAHMIDTERVMSYRALCFARNDDVELSDFEQDGYIENSDFDACKLSDLTKEFEYLRQANILMFKNLTAEAWDRMGVASGKEISVRALAHIIAGHEIHHVRILREKYLS